MLDARAAGRAALAGVAVAGLGFGVGSGAQPAERLGTVSAASTSASAAMVLTAAAPPASIPTTAVSTSWLPAQRRGPTNPSRLRHLGTATQVIVVSAPRWRSAHGTLRAYELTADGHWQLAFAPVRGALGRHGLVWAASRRQGSGMTPAGTFGVTQAFGRVADPGTALPYTAVDGDDAWPYDPRDPATYNVLQTTPPAGRWRAGYVERLRSYGRQYDYAAVLDFNLPRPPYLKSGSLWRAAVPADTRAGGGIFLHANKKVRGVVQPTAGCISVPRATMRALLRWLDPAASPVVVVAPTAALPRA
ncbi:MAG: cell wall-binding protein [Actinomycetota bacterium]|nr:MAG: cell wall-binding protein [Actinomycetota bacterium]